MAEFFWLQALFQIFCVVATFLVDVIKYLKELLLKWIFVSILSGCSVYRPIMERKALWQRFNRPGLGELLAGLTHAWWIIKESIQEVKLVHSLWGLLPLTMSTSLAPCPNCTTASQSSTSNLGSTLQIHEHEGDISISHLKTLSFCAGALVKQADVGKSPLWGLFNFWVCSHGPHYSQELLHLLWGWTFCLSSSCLYKPFE